MLTNPLVKSLVSTSLAKYLTGGAFLGRNYIDLDSTASAHYLLAKPKVFAGDFEIGVTFSTTSISFQYLSGVTTGFNDYIALRGSNSRIEVRIGGGSVLIFEPPTLTDGKFHSLVVRRVAGVPFAIVDGVNYPEVAAATNVDALNLGLFGQNAASGYFDGIISQVNLTDLTTPANSEYYRLNSLTKEYELPSNNVFGSELVTNGDFATDSDWVLQAAIIASGVCSVASVVGSRGVIRQQISAPIGPILIKFTITNLVGSLSVQIRNTSNSINTYTQGIGSNGAYEFLATQTDILANLILFQCNDGSSGSFDIDDVSVKQITNYLTYQNIALGKPTRDTYTLVDGDWLGSELVTNGNFATDTDWTNKSGVTISGGTLNTDGTVTGELSRQSNLGIVELNTYQLQYSISNIAAGDLGAKLGGGASSFNSIDGDYVVSIAGGSVDNIQPSADNGFATGSMDNVSLKRKIEVAP